MDADQINKIEKLVGRLSKNRGERTTIYRVPAHIRESCKNYFEPRVVSIGPYHRGLPHLKAMEKLKHRYLANFLFQSGRSMKDYINVLMPLEPDARRCYFERVGPVKEKFVAMLLLDGCFIIELLRRSHDIRNGVISSDEEINNSVLPGWIKAFVKTDLLMLENQIPYTVLKTLYDTYLSSSNVPQDAELPRRSSLYQLITSFFFENRNMAEDKAFGENIDHLLHFYHRYFVPRMDESRKPDLLVSIEEPKSPINQEGSRMVRLLRKWNSFNKRFEDKFTSTPFFASGLILPLEYILFSLMARYMKLVLLGSFVHIERTTSGIRCATELQEFGVSIRKKREPTSFLDVTFSFRSLLIPRTVIDKATRSNYMNLVAFEQSSDRVNKDLTGYAVFMNCLISKPEDLVILKRKEIIENKLPNDEQVVLFFNDLRACAYNYDSNYFKALFKDTNCYCGAPFPSQRASIFHNFRNSRWTVISGIIVLILLCASIYQVFISSFNYFHPHRSK